MATDWLRQEDWSPGVTASLNQALPDPPRVVQQRPDDELVRSEGN
jgi:hypothetical protein